MADKLRKLYQLPISFQDGELPNAKKFTALSSQPYAAFAAVELAIGDLWNQSGDAVLIDSSVTENALYLPQLARVIGKGSFMGPRVPYLSAIQNYYNYCGNATGKFEILLDFPPEVGSAWRRSLNGGDSWSSVTPETSLGDVSASGDFYVDTDTGWLFSYDALGASVIYQFKPVVSGDIPGEREYPVIPHLNTDTSYAFKSVKIEYVNGSDGSAGYYISLPPRGPLSSGARYAGRDMQDGITAPVHTDNIAADGNSGDRLLFQDDSVVAATAATYRTHYRYRLPAAITDNWSAGATLPEGMVYLFDPATGTIIEGLTLTAPTPTRKYGFIAAGSGLDAYLASANGVAVYPDANLQSSSELAALYPAGGLKVIQTGSASLAYTSALILNKAMGKDTGSTFWGPLTSHAKITDNFDPLDVGNPKFNPSTLDNDWHPQYLHRKGLNASARDEWMNGMLGDLFMMSTVPGAFVDYDNLDGDSYGVQFGIAGGGPKLYYDKTEDQMSLTTKDLWLQEIGARYQHGQQNHYIWVNLQKHYDRTGNWVETWEAGDPIPYLVCAGGGILSVLIDDWPQDMILFGIQLDVDPMGDPLTVEPYRIVYPTATGNANVAQSFSGTQASRAGAPHTDIQSSSATRLWLNYVPTNIGDSPGTNDWSHGTHKLFLHFSTTGSCRIHGVRLQASYVNVSKWAQ